MHCLPEKITPVVSYLKGRYNSRRKRFEQLNDGKKNSYRSLSDCSVLKLYLPVRRQWQCSKRGIAPEMVKKIMQCKYYK